MNTNDYQIQNDNKNQENLLDFIYYNLDNTFSAMDGFLTNYSLSGIYPFYLNNYLLVYDILLVYFILIILLLFIVYDSNIFNVLIIT